MCGRWKNGGDEYRQHFRDLALKGGRRLVAEEQSEEDSSFLMKAAQTCYMLPIRVRMKGWSQSKKNTQLWM